ncbi:MAG: hypothetical protein F6K39_23825 [Okeania sp. SIO3B3]|nr:hypothetical protein [Okeania sp. SIO3B3]
MAFEGKVRIVQKFKLKQRKFGCISILNKAKKLLLLGNREQGTGNREYIGKKYFCKYEMHPKIFPSSFCYIPKIRNFIKTLKSVKFGKHLIMAFEGKVRIVQKLKLRQSKTFPSSFFLLPSFFFLLLYIILGLKS